MTPVPLARQPRNIKRGITITSILMLLLFLLSGCNGDPQVQQKADTSKADLDHLIVHAQNIGVPSLMLRTIIDQEAQLSNTNSPLTVFGNQPATNYYSNLAQRYQLLTLQLQGLENQATQQLDHQAFLDIQSLENALAVRQAQNFIEAKTFAGQLAQAQNRLAAAQTPNDYIHISEGAKRSVEALHLMGPAYNTLVSLQQTITQLQKSKLDTTALVQATQDDLQLFRNATKPEDFTQLINQMNAQLQETATFSTEAIPYVGAAKLQQFSAEIDQTKLYGQNVSSFQQRLQADSTALKNASSLAELLKVSAQIDKDIASIQVPMIHGQAIYLLKQFHQEVTHWGSTHQYHDSYDGGIYNLDYEYDQQGIGADADAAVANAESTQSLDDYQAAIDLITNDLVHLKAMEADYSDKTPWNQVHKTDVQLMQHYNITSGRVLVVSLLEQTVRFYQDGKLMRSFQIVSGQYLRPSLPGYWSIILRQHPTVFKSGEPKGSAFWYPPTPIDYAMEYHDQGYFFHDSPWRTYYGQGINFPHYDPQGETFSGNGSHGCINMQPADVAWLYNNTSYGDNVLVY